MKKVICIKGLEPYNKKGQVFKVLNSQNGLLDLGFKDENGNINWMKSKRFRPFDPKSITLSLAFQADERSLERLDIDERVFTTEAKF